METQWTTLSKLIRNAGRFWDISSEDPTSQILQIMNIDRFLVNGAEGDMARLISKDWQVVLFFFEKGLLVSQKSD